MRERARGASGSFVQDCCSIQGQDYSANGDESGAYGKTHAWRTETRTPRTQRRRGHGDAQRETKRSVRGRAAPRGKQRTLRCFPKSSNIQRKEGVSFAAPQIDHATNTLCCSDQPASRVCVVSPPWHLPRVHLPRYPFAPLAQYRLFQWLFPVLRAPIGGHTGSSSVLRVFSTRDSFRRNYVCIPTLVAACVLLHFPFSSLHFAR